MWCGGYRGLRFKWTFYGRLLVVPPERDDPDNKLSGLPNCTAAGTAAATYGKKATGWGQDRSLTLQKLATLNCTGGPANGRACAGYLFRRGGYLRNGGKPVRFGMESDPPIKI